MEGQVGAVGITRQDRKATSGEQSLALVVSLLAGSGQWLVAGRAALGMGSARNPFEG